MQPTCFEMDCQIAYANKTLSKNKQFEVKKKKQVTQAQNKARKELNWNDVKWLKKQAENVCNRYIRLRDQKLHGNTCISCGYDFKIGGRVKNAGHYKPQGGNSLWRYDERNIHLQCDRCNMHLAANLTPYRVNLIAKVGIEVVEELENTKTPKRWSVEELKEIIETYKLKIKELV